MSQYGMAPRNFHDLPRERPRHLDPDWVRPPLGRHAPGWAERVSDMWIARTEHDRAAEARCVMADLLARRHVTEADLLRAAERMRDAS